MTCFITNVCIGHLCNHETLNLFNVLHIAFCHSWIVNSSSPSRLLVGITHFYFKRNLLLKLKKLTSGLLKNLEQNKWLLNLENFTSHCLKNPEILLVLLIGPLLIRPDCVYIKVYTQSPIIRNGPIRLSAEFWGKFKKRALGRSNLRNTSKNLRNAQCSDFQS